MAKDNSLTVLLGIVIVVVLALVMDRLDTYFNGLPPQCGKHADLVIYRGSDGVKTQQCIERVERL